MDYSPNEIEELKQLQGTRDCQHYDTNPWAEYDGYGIYLCRVCEDCEAVKMATYRPDIKECFDPGDDTIEPEEL